MPKGGKNKPNANKNKKGKNPSKKGKKKGKVKKDHERKGKDDVDQSSHAEEGNVNSVDPGKRLSKKEKREKKKESKKSTSNDHTRPIDSTTESNETLNVALRQSNTNSENVDDIQLSLHKDNANQQLTKDDSVSSGETLNSSDQQSTSQDKQQITDKDKLEAKGAHNSAKESNAKSNDAKSKKTDGVPPTPPLEDFLVKPNQTLMSMTENNISSALSGIDKLGFTSLNQQQVERCIQWIIEQSIDTSITDAQGLYLCAVLGHLAVTTSPDKYLELPKGGATTGACDLLLRYLMTSFRKKLCSSPKCSALLEAIAPVLVDNSSSPGWLAFAANFLPLFGMKYIVEMKIASPKYEKDSYIRLYYLLLSHDIVNIGNAHPEDKPYYNPFLRRILKFAPDECTLFKVFASKEIKRFFYNQQNQEKFCTNFYKDNVLTSSGENVSISEKLQQLIYLPKNLRVQLSGVLYSYLLEFIKSVEKPTEKDVENFMDIQLSLHKLNNDQIHTILMLLSTSETVQYQELLLKLLNDDRFRNQWGNVKRTTKIQICTTWVKTRACANEVSKIKVTRAYQVAAELISCRLVNEVKDLGKMLLESVREWLFQNVEPKVIFQELKDLEKFPQSDVRESCIHLIKEVLHKYLHIVNEQRLLSQFSHSRFYIRILSYALEKLQIPEPKKQVDPEDIFEKMLPWCGIWLTLLRAQGKVV